MQENNSKIVGEVIAEAREKAGLSQRQLAKKANINNSELSKIEAGIRKDPSPRILRKISNHLDVNYNDLMYMIGLGVQVSPLNPFILNHYANLRGEELENAWITAMSSIKNNQIIIDSLQNQINSDNNLNDNDKEVIIETIEDLKYQNNTNNEIIKLLDSIKYKEGMKNTKNKNLS